MVGHLRLLCAESLGRVYIGLRHVRLEKVMARVCAGLTWVMLMVAGQC